MPRPVLFVTIPGLRHQDVDSMPHLKRLVEGGDRSSIQHSFPCVTWPSQSHVLTGKLANEHGVVANGFYWRDEQRVEMWTAWNDKILAPQIWDMLHDQSPSVSSSAWFPMLSKGSGADYVCMPAPIHKPDGSEEMWCYTKPQEYYGKLLDELGPFPLQHFWGPMANIKSSAWIAKSACLVAKEFKPGFNYIYLPHLDYAAQKLGPDSDAARNAVKELDDVIGEMAPLIESAYAPDAPIWIFASEYVITAVDHVSYPNRILREAGLLTTKPEGDSERELIDETGPAWALVDHQFSHVFVRNQDADTIEKIVELFQGREGIAEVLAGDGRAKYGMDHERSGEVILISTPDSWQAYYWWDNDDLAPSFARTVDIHRKPGYDPVELHFDMQTKSIPLDATLIKGSHGAPANTDAQRGALYTSEAGLFRDTTTLDTDIAAKVLGLYS